MGIVDLSRWQSERWPRFTVDGVHRTISLLALGGRRGRVLTTVLDSFTQISLRRRGPFRSPRATGEIWVGAGALAFDLLIAPRPHEHPQASHRPPDVADRPLERLRVLAARPGARPRDGKRRNGSVDARDQRVGCLGVGSGTSAGASQLRGRAATAAGRWPPSAIGVGLGTCLSRLASNWAARSGTPAPILTAFAPPAGRTSQVADAAGAGSQLSFPRSARLSGHAVQRSEAPASWMSTSVRRCMAPRRARSRVRSSASRLAVAVSR